MTDVSKATFSESGEADEAGQRRGGEPPHGYERVPEGIGFGDRLLVWPLILGPPT